jgi:hypothetical protein
MDEMYIFTSVAFFIWALRSIFYWINQWQRLSSGTLQVRSPFKYVVKTFFSPFSVISWLGIIFAFYVTIVDLPLIYYESFIFFIFIFKAIFTLIDLGSGQIGLPKFTWQNSIISSLAVILTGAVIVLPLTERYLWLLLVDRMLFIFVALPVFLILFPSEILDDIQLRRAGQLVRKFKRIKPVFILGENSSETAYFMQQIIRKKKNVVVIESPFMRPGFVAKSILKNTTPQTDYIFVVIPTLHLASLSTIARVIPPSFVIFLEKDPKLFQRTLKMIDPFISKNAFIVVDELLQHKQKVKRKNIYSFTTLLDGNEEVNAFVYSLNQKKDELQLFININKKDIHITTPVIGKHHVLYLLPGFLFALLSGMTEEELLAAQSYISPLSGRLVGHTLHSGIAIIDATRIKHVDEVKGALEYLKIFHKKRIVVFGIGDEISTEEIKSLKSEFSLPTRVIVLKQRYQQLIRRLVHVGTGKSDVKFDNLSGVRLLISEELAKGDVVVLLGQDSEELVESILLSSRTLR